MKRIELSGCAIIENENLFLLYKKKHKHYEFCGGKVEQGESLEQAAIREVKEETGCDVELGKYLGYEDFTIDERDFRSHKFLGKIKQGQIPKPNKEEGFTEIIWMPIEDYQKYPIAPNVREFCKKYLDKKLPI